MRTIDFYDLLDLELVELVKKYEGTSFFGNQNDMNAKKSKCFILWFLNNYAPHISNPIDCIVDGSDDMSCDAIYSYYNEDNKPVFYVIQSKWFSKNSISSSNKISTEIKACIDDFKVLLAEKKQIGNNDAFNNKYTELINHKLHNGKIHFIFLALCKGTNSVDDNIIAFETPLRSFEILDIERLKNIYIETNYKNAKASNPLEIPCRPESIINIKIEPENNIVVKSPFKSYVFMTSPLEIFKLYESYGNSLFYANIRNPLEKSDFNEGIGSTLELEPNSFWYFNNGITAIAKQIHDFHEESNNVSITGIQIINGAQTVRSIHRAFKSIRSETEKSIINDKAKIMIRILESAGKSHDLKVTRFTNSQNPIYDRDFHSNDDEQEKLQRDFFTHTNYWYERRRGEFEERQIPKFIKIISNETFAQTYLAYSCNEPVRAKNDKKYIFVSNNFNKENGLYETIFSNATYDEMLASYLLYNFIEGERKRALKVIKEVSKKDLKDITAEDKQALNKEFIQHCTFHILSAMKIKLSKRYKTTKELNNRVIYLYEKAIFDEFVKDYSEIITRFETEVINRLKTDITFSLSKYFKSKDSKDLVNSII